MWLVWLLVLCANFRIQFVLLCVLHLVNRGCHYFPLTSSLAFLSHPTDVSINNLSTARISLCSAIISVVSGVSAHLPLAATFRLATTQPTSGIIVSSIRTSCQAITSIHSNVREQQNNAQNVKAGTVHKNATSDPGSQTRGSLVKTLVR